MLGEKAGLARGVATIPKWRGCWGAGHKAPGPSSQACEGQGCLRGTPEQMRGCVWGRRHLMQLSGLSGRESSFSSSRSAACTVKPYFPDCPPSYPQCPQASGSPLPARRVPPGPSAVPDTAWTTSGHRVVRRGGAGPNLPPCSLTLGRRPLVQLGSGCLAGAQGQAGGDIQQQLQWVAPPPS